MLYKLIQIIKSLNKRELIALIVCVSVIALSGSFFLIRAITEQTEESPAFGGTWREGSIGQPVFVNPIISGNDVDQEISRLIFASLSEMADTVRIEDDGRTWTVRLKEGLKWHDGEKITSDDIIYTFDTIVDPESNSPIAGNFDGATISRVSELEVRFNLPSSYVFFETTIDNMRIIPKHIFGNIPPANFNLSSFVREPVGSGPYKFQSYGKEKGGFVSEYKLIANNEYFGKKPYIQNIVFKFYADESQMAKGYINGEIDGFIAQNPKTAKTISVRRTVNALSAPRYYAVFLNPSLISAFRDESTRKKLSAAVSRDKIATDVFDGFAEPVFSPLTEEPFTPEKEDLVDNSLEGLVINLTVPDIQPLIETATIIKSDWESYGATVNISSLRPADIQEIIKNRSYEALLFGNILNEPEDLYSFWHSSKRFYPGLNLAGFNDKTADALMETIRVTGDKEERKIFASHLASIIAESAGAVFIISPDYVYITSPKLHGFRAEGIITAADRLSSVSDWYVNTIRKIKK
ncbi:MAG: ABC transporter substrate-binding protein [Candidatus Colwellbacteria bacterium]|nr:ABC transporter substrate-binding protein [Candidatus Colwellbacteria bacterium]